MRAADRAARSFLLLGSIGFCSVQRKNRDFGTAQKEKSPLFEGFFHVFLPLFRFLKKKAIFFEKGLDKPNERVYNNKRRESGGTGRRARLRGVWFIRTGSSPVSRTKKERSIRFVLFLSITE